MFFAPVVCPLPRAGEIRQVKLFHSTKKTEQPAERKARTATGEAISHELRKEKPRRGEAKKC